jgi:glycosyltransferase involved in cell wall biosynthesis
MEPTIRRFFQSLFSFKYLIKLTLKLRSFKPDVVFAHSVCGIISPSFLLATRWYDVPVIYQIPNLSRFPPSPSPRGPRSLVVWFKRTVHRWLLATLPAAYIAPSKTSAAYLQARLGISDVHVIPHPTFWESPSSPITDGTDSLNVVYVGRISGKKGVETAIDAIGIASENYDIRFDIYGDGKIESRLRRSVTEASLSSEICFHGWTEHDALPSVYRNADATLVPSVVHESFGLTIVESMSQGTPVITTDIGAQNELVEDGQTGFLVEPRSAEEIASLLQRLAEDETLLQQLSENALAASERYSSSSHVERMLSLFRSLQE